MTDDPAEAMINRLRGDLKAAMRARVASDVAALRSLIAAIDNAQAVSRGDEREARTQRKFGDSAAEATRRALSEGEVDALLREEAAKWSAAAEEMGRCGRPAEAAALREQALVVGRYRS